MSKQTTPWGARRIYGFIKARRHEFDVKTMCNALGVTRSGYYAWLHNPTSNRGIAVSLLLAIVVKAPPAASQPADASSYQPLDLKPGCWQVGAHVSAWPA